MKLKPGFAHERELSLCTRAAQRGLAGAIVLADGYAAVGEE
jgi:hypothetical protein